MSELVVQAVPFDIQPLADLRDGPAILRWAYSRSFLSSEGIQVQRGTVNSGFGIEVPCSIASGLITVDQDSLLWTTDDAQDRSPASILISAWLLTPRGVIVAQLSIGSKVQWVVPSSQVPTTTWELFSNYNLAVHLGNAPDFWYTAAEVDRVIDIAFTTHPASDTELGTVLLSVPADIPETPVVWGANDPLVRDAVAIQGVNISPTPPLDTQTLIYNEANNQYEPSNQAAGTGNVISNEIVSVDGELALMSGTGGKTIRKGVRLDNPSELLGRGDSGGGDPELIQLGSGLSMTGTELSATGTGGDVTAAANLTDNALVLGDGGVKGVKTDTPTFDGTALDVSGARVIAAEYDSDSANLADNGTIRLNKDDFLAWRNEVNGGNILLSKNVSDEIEASGGFAGVVRPDGTVPFAAEESMGGFKLVDVASPDDLTDAANKDFVLQSVAAAVQQTPNISALVSGGGVLWEADYDFRVSQATYLIQGDLFTSIEQTISLDAADPVLDRIDVIALDNTGTVVKVTGTAAAQPSQPEVDPGTQLLLTFVFVGAATTEPPNVSNEDLYIDNTEWTATTSGVGWDVNSTNNPHSGTKDIEGTNVANNAFVRLEAPSPLTLDTFALLSVFIRSKAAWPKNRSLLFQWYSAGVAKGVAVTINTGFFGFDSSQTATYQLLAIPIAQFAVPAGTSINQLRITDKGGAIGMYIDDLVLQDFGGDIGTPPTPGLTQEQADARYAQRTNNLSDLNSASSARTNLGLGALATVTPGTGVATALGVNVGSAGAPVVNGGALGTPSSGALTNCTADGANLVGFRNIPQRASSVDTTTVAGDAGGHLYHPVSDDNPRTFTIDANTDVPYVVGTAITFINDQNTLTIAIDSDTLVWAEDGSTGSRTLAENGMATAIKVTSTRWIISGTGLS